MPWWLWIASAVALSVWGLIKHRSNEAREVRYPDGALSTAGDVTDVWFVSDSEPNGRYPKLIAKSGLSHRLAIIQHTAYAPERDNAFDQSLWASVVDYVVGYVEDGQVTVANRLAELGRREVTLQTHLSNWSSPAEGDRTPPAALIVRVSGQPRLCVLFEDYAAVGGPFPYHDSYTYSVFTDRDLRVELPTFLRARAEGRWNLATEVLTEKG